MTKDLTSSTVSRQNILNNHYALEQIGSALALGGTYWHDEAVFTKAQVVEILGVNTRTVERYLESDNEELAKNGYKVLKGKELKDFKEYVSDIDVGDMLKTPSLGVFSFRAVLNIAMLVTESEKAKAIRSKMLDIVIDVVAQKAGGHTKYINQRDKDYLRRHIKSTAIVKSLPMLSTTICKQTAGNTANIQTKYIKSCLWKMPMSIKKYLT
jgi:hypothetical protein